VTLIDSDIPATNDVLRGGLEVLESGVTGMFETNASHESDHVSGGMAMDKYGKMRVSKAECFQLVCDAVSYIAKA
jgi:hypothetical protein